jgi:hypothetical protein
MIQRADPDAVPALQGARLLVVEDEALLLLELESILMGAGAEVVSVCRTVADGLAAAQQQLGNDPAIAERQDRGIIAQPIRAGPLESDRNDRRRRTGTGGVMRIER